MKAPFVSILLSVVSLAAVGILYLKVDDLSEQWKNTRADRGESRAARSGDHPDYVIRADAGTNAPAASGRPSGAAAPATRDEEIQALRDEIASLKKTVHRNDASTSMPRFRTSRHVASVDQMAKQLKLTSTQRDRIDAAVQRGKERLDAILSIPGADGKSPKEAREEQRKKIREAMADPERKAGSLVTLALNGHRRLQEKIPGRNETYQQELDRVKKETREEIVSNLTPEQAEEFGDTRVDPLLGQGGAGMTFATSFVGPGGESSESTGIMVVDVESEQSGASGKE